MVYTIECALKSCIAKSYAKYSFPDKRKVLDSHTHDLEKLLKIAQLENQLKADAENNPVLMANWITLKDWKETSRYEIKSSLEAESLKKAINEPINGIWKWVRQYW